MLHPVGWLKENFKFILGTTGALIFILAFMFLPPIIKDRMRKANEREKQENQAKLSNASESSKSTKKTTGEIL